MNIHCNTTASDYSYHEKLILSPAEGTNDITVQGISDCPGNAQPTLNFNNATTSSNMSDSYSAVEQNAGILALGEYDTNITGITIRNLHLTGASQGNAFTDSTGTKQTFAEFSAAIYIEGAINVSILSNTLDTNGIGLFALTNDGNEEVVENLLVQGNTFKNNGVVGSFFEHNSYVEAKGVVYEYNDYQSLTSGAEGATLKDRSAGAIIRYNYFAPSATILDLVDAEDSAMLVELPSYADTYVYGNVLDNTGPSATGIVTEFGNDSGGDDCRPNLYFYDNTVVSSTLTSLFNAQCGNANKFYVANNIFYSPSASNTATALSLDWGSGTFIYSKTNWFSPGWYRCSGAVWGSSACTDSVTGTSTFLSPANNDPGFVNLAGGNYQLAAGSSALGAGGPLGSGWPTVTSDPASVGPGATPTPRSNLDIGA